MNKKIETIRLTRSFLLTYIDSLTTEQLNIIPPGFNNNIIWNLGHLVAAQQGLCYGRSGLAVKINEDFFTRYKTGSAPDGVIQEEEVEIIKGLLISTIQGFSVDFANNIFSGYQPLSTRYGVVLGTIDEALDFISFHEGMHTGVIMALKKIVSQP